MGIVFSFLAGVGIGYFVFWVKSRYQEESA